MKLFDKRDTARDTAPRTEKKILLAPLDYLVFGVVALTAVALAALRICPVDWLWACAAILVIAFWAFLIHRAIARRNRER